jgi:hypothetical protein
MSMLLQLKIHAFFMETLQSWYRYGGRTESTTPSLIRSHSNETNTYLAGQTFFLCLAERCALSGHIEGMYSSALSLKRVCFD